MSLNSNPLQLIKRYVDMFYIDQKDSRSFCILCQYVVEPTTEIQHLSDHRIPFKESGLLPRLPRALRIDSAGSESQVPREDFFRIDLTHTSIKTYCTLCGSRNWIRRAYTLNKNATLGEKMHDHLVIYHGVTNSILTD